MYESVVLNVKKEYFTIILLLILSKLIYAYK